MDEGKVSAAAGQNGMASLGSFFFGPGGAWWSGLLATFLAGADRRRLPIWPSAMTVDAITYSGDAAVLSFLMNEATVSRPSI
jgi:hypothetical protein